MVLVLKKGASKKDIQKIEQTIFKEKNSGGFNAKKYNGIMNLEEDPLTIQKTLRNEWKRDIS
jgi:hypothetical protein